MALYEIARGFAQEALVDLLRDPTTKDRAKGNEILEWIDNHKPKPEVDQIRPSWGAYLTKMTTDPASRIDREPGRYGYILRKEPAPTPAVAVQIETSAPSTSQAVPAISTATPLVSPPVLEPVREEREQKLYALLVEWLQAQDRRAADTSKSKKGGAWGNPDVVGIRVDELMGSIHFEITTIEAKLSEKDWRRIFFEAVSHKRFADRAYFAFATASDEPIVSRLEEFQELREYGEKYRIGVLVVFMEPEQYNQLTSGSVADINLSLDDVRVEEVWPAISDKVSPFTQNNFLRDVLEISSQKELFEFGAS